MIDDWKTWRKTERAVRISGIHGVVQIVCNFAHKFHLKVEILQPLENTVHSWVRIHVCPPLKLFTTGCEKRTQMIILYFYGLNEQG